jgi:hypothetical protein
LPLELLVEEESLFMEEAQVESCGGTQAIAVIFMGRVVGAVLNVRCEMRAT